MAMPRPWWGWSPLSAMYEVPSGGGLHCHRLSMSHELRLCHELTHTGKISPSMLLRRLQLPMAVAWHVFLGIPATQKSVGW